MEKGDIQQTTCKTVNVHEYTRKLIQMERFHAIPCLQNLLNLLFQPRRPVEMA